MNAEQEPSTELSVAQCEELAVALTEEAAALPPGADRCALLQLAQSYSDLARMKRTLMRYLD
jgi:hypothetical protein